MIKAFLRKHKLTLWQAGFIITGTSWLLAPTLNTVLSPRLSLISQYETAAQPYSLVFRLFDITSSLLLIGAVIYLQRHAKLNQTTLLLLGSIGVLSLVDPIATTNCLSTGKICTEGGGVQFWVHAVETVLLASSIFVLSAYDMVRRKTTSSTVFVLFQIVYLLAGIAAFAETYRYATASQFAYQFAVTCWIAWFVVSTTGLQTPHSEQNKRTIRHFFAAWAYINGGLAIFLSISHIKIFKHLNGLYFANDTAWLAQHSVLIGVAMIYISRQLWRGEHRARLLMLGLLFVEIIKYAVIVPSGWLVVLYGITFVVLLSARPYFTRGSAQVGWATRLQDAGLVLAGVITSVGVTLIVFAENPRRLEIARDAFNDLGGFLVEHNPVHRSLVPSAVLAHTVTVLIVGTVFFTLLSLFRPIRQQNDEGDADYERATEILNDYAVSSEDFFKVWPHDKYFFWSTDKSTFIAYKITKSVVYALSDPIGPNDQLRQSLLQEFTNYWSAHSYIVCFILAPEQSLPMYKQAGLNTHQMGAAAVINVHTFSDVTVRNKWWRWQNNRSTKAGSTYAVSKPPHSTRIIRQAKHVSSAWHSRPGRQEQGFAMGSFSVDYLQQSTIHYLVGEDDRMVAFANEIPTYNQLRQNTIDLMRFVPEANNTMPVLLANIIKHTAASGLYDTFDLGFVPLAETKGAVATITKLLGSARFSPAGLEQFKNKFEPEWQKSYLAYDGDVANLAIIALNLDEVMEA